MEEFAVAANRKLIEKQAHRFASALLLPLFGGRPGVLPLLAALAYAVLLPLLALRRLRMIPAGGAET